MQCGNRSSTPLKLALFGYGKMGKMVEKAAQAKGFLIESISSSSKDNPNLTNVDVIIDFTSPEAVLENVRKAGESQKNIVIGTTGWQNQMDAVKQMVHEYGIGALYSPNFSIGVLLFMQLIARATQLISPYEQYAVGGFEIHHQHKKDAPSGTAKGLADSIQKNWQGKDKLTSLNFGFSRFGFNPGTHTITFDSPEDTITLTHSAKGRDGFANGALIAAEWLHQKKGFYTLEDILCNSKAFTQH